MEFYPKDVLLSNYQNIIEDLNVDDILPMLIQEKVFSIDDAEIIRSEVGHKKKAEKLVSYLVTKGSHAFTSFYQALKQCNSHLAGLLTPQQDTSSNFFYFITSSFVINSVV